MCLPLQHFMWPFLDYDICHICIKVVLEFMLWNKKIAISPECKKLIFKNYIKTVGKYSFPNKEMKTEAMRQCPWQRMSECRFSEPWGEQHCHQPRAWVSSVLGNVRRRCLFPKWGPKHAIRPSHLDFNKNSNLWLLGFTKSLDILLLIFINKFCGDKTSLKKSGRWGCV